MVQRGRCFAISSRRGRLDPGRRGPRTFDHFRSARGPFRKILQRSRRLPSPSGSRPTTRSTRKRRPPSSPKRHRGRWRTYCAARPAEETVICDIEKRRWSPTSLMRRAHRHIPERDKDYIVRTTKSSSSTGFTGRMMPGRHHVLRSLRQTLEARTRYVDPAGKKPDGTVTFYFRT